MGRGNGAWEDKGEKGQIPGSRSGSSPSKVAKEEGDVKKGKHGDGKDEHPLRYAQKRSRVRTPTLAPVV